VLSRRRLAALEDLTWLASGQVRQVYVVGEALRKLVAHTEEIVGQG
jgi:hypothetical protein